MTISNYLLDKHIMTTEVANTFPFFGADYLQTTEMLMRVNYGSREMIFENESEVQLIVLSVFNSMSYNWQKIYDTMHLQYNALETTKIEETTSEINSGSDSTTTESENTNTATTTPATVNTISKNAYDNVVSFIDTEKTTQSGTNTVAGNDNSTNIGSISYGKNTSTTHNKTGREGANIQEIINKERLIAEINLTGMIAEEISNTIAYLNYNFE